MIYFMRAGDSGHVKIGYTRDQMTLQNRKVTLQTGQPFPLVVIRVIDPAPPWGEVWLHCFFSGVRAAGEWFSFHHEMLTIEPPSEKPKKIYPPPIKDIHVWLPDNDAEQIAALARAEDRSLTNMVLVLVRPALALGADGNEPRVRRGRPCKPPAPRGETVSAEGE